MICLSRMFFLSGQMAYQCHTSWIPMGSVAFLEMMWDFRVFTTIWHSIFMAYFRVQFTEWVNRMKESQIFPKASEWCKLKHIIWDLMECQVSGCFDLKWVNTLLARLIWGGLGPDILFPHKWVADNQVSFVVVVAIIKPYKAFRKKLTDHITWKKHFNTCDFTLKIWGNKSYPSTDYFCWSMKYQRVLKDGLKAILTLEFFKRIAMKKWFKTLLSLWLEAGTVSGIVGFAFSLGFSPM